MRFMQTLAEQRAVGQPGELVVMGQIAHALFGFAPRRQIGEEADDMADISPTITHCIQLQPLRIQLAVLARLHQFALPTAVLLKCMTDGDVMAAGITAAR